MLGLDLSPVEPHVLPPNATVLQQDVTTWKHGEKKSFDVLLSDMAPKTTGASGSLSAAAPVHAGSSAHAHRSQGSRRARVVRAVRKGTLSSHSVASEPWLWVICC